MLQPENIDHDTRWKEIIEQLFEGFVAFFRNPNFLKQEFYKIVAIPKKEGIKINDSLVKVFLKNGTTQWILIHNRHPRKSRNRIFREAEKTVAIQESICRSSTNQERPE